jgi:hypothetical protein
MQMGIRSRMGPAPPTRFRLLYFYEGSPRFPIAYNTSQPPNRL